MKFFDYCLLAIKRTIPPHILNTIFKKNYELFDIYPELTTVDEGIRQKIFRERILIDLNIVGGVELVIPVIGAGEILDDFNHIYRIPKTQTQNRNIISVLSYTMANPNFPSAPMNLPMRDGSMYGRSGSLVMEAHGTIPITSSANASLVGENTILLRDTYLLPLVAYFKVLVSNDDELSNISPKNFITISQLAILATKSYIYNQHIIRMSEGEIRGGYELGVFKSKVEEYADSEELYNDMLKTKIMKILFMNDKPAYHNYVRSGFHVHY